MKRILLAVAVIVAALFVNVATASASGPGISSGSGTSSNPYVIYASHGTWDWDTLARGCKRYQLTSAVNAVACFEIDYSAAYENLALGDHQADLWVTGFYQVGCQWVGTSNGAPCSGKDNTWTFRSTGDFSHSTSVHYACGVYNTDTPCPSGMHTSYSYDSAGNHGEILAMSTTSKSGKCATWHMTNDPIVNYAGLWHAWGTYGSAYYKICETA